MHNSRDGGSEAPILSQ